MNRHLFFIRARRAVALALALSGLLATPAPAGLLPSSAWVVGGPDDTSVSRLTDQDPRTGSLLQSRDRVLRCTIDLGAVATIQRVYFTSRRDGPRPLFLNTEQRPAPGLTVRIRVGKKRAAANELVASRLIRVAPGGEIRAEANLRFQPAVGRFVVLEIDRAESDRAWDLGEVEIYGWPGDHSSDRSDAVVVAPQAAPPLQLAAEELSYYLGELAGHPVPRIAPEQAARYTGTLFRVEDLAPLARTYEQMTNSQARGLLPATPVNVERVGRGVVFRAWPYRNALWSVWEFLERQGVRWVYPDAHGDWVPAGRGIDLGIAPFRFTPSTDYIYANFGAEYLRDDPDAFLHFWRNRWTHTWGGHQVEVLGGAEVPAPPRPRQRPGPDHVEGFDGYPHNFKNVLPERVLRQHPEWCGLVTNAHGGEPLRAAQLNRRLPPGENGCTFDLTSPGARRFIVDKAIDCWGDHLSRHGPILWLLPEDSMRFSEDAESIRLRSPLRGDDLPYAMPYPFSVSGDYYDFVCHVAQALRGALPEARIGALAYSNTHRPPDRVAPFPGNVLVEVCLYGARNLPFDSPRNAEMRERLEAWTRLAPNLRHYDYDLIHSERAALPMPVPLVHAMASRAGFFRDHHLLAGGTQADLESLRFNPWNYYAYPRLYWNVDEGAGRILSDFFAGYYREAAAPMLEYYRSAEDSLVANNVSLQGPGYGYALVPDAYPLPVLATMHRHLLAAERAATYWVTRERVQAAREGFDWMLQERGWNIEKASRIYQ